MHSYHHSFIKIYSGDTDPQPTCKQHVMLCSCQLSGGLHLGSIRAGAVPPFTERGTLPVEFLLHRWIKGRSACKSPVHQKVLVQFPKPEQCSRWKKPVGKKIHIFQEEFHNFFFHKITRIFFSHPSATSNPAKAGKDDWLCPSSPSDAFIIPLHFLFYFFTTAETNESN